MGCGCGQQTNIGAGDVDLRIITDAVDYSEPSAVYLLPQVDIVEEEIVEEETVTVYCRKESGQISLGYKVYVVEDWKTEMTVAEALEATSQHPNKFSAAPFATVSATPAPVLTDKQDSEAGE